MSRTVDLRSDTVTRPSEGMIRAMARAEVGDDVLGDDPTVRRLEEVGAERMGKEAGLFVPSGTMGNQVAVRGHTVPGDRVLAAEQSHVVAYEAGAPAVISGVLVSTIPARNGLLDPEDVERAIPPDDVHFAPATLLCVENTANRGGGTVYPLERLDALARVASGRGLATHLDGARIFDAQVASGVAAYRIARDYDSVCFCLSKSLGAPVGSVLCGPADWIARARRTRKMLGGGMRQAGYLAAAGLYALEYNVERLAEDHERARRLWSGLKDAGWSVARPETNMVYVIVPGAPEVERRLAAEGVLAKATAPDRIRLVTHLDLSDEDVEWALAVFSVIGAGA